jgi:ribosomal protein S18 acetylase RimI-like enzyme
MGFYREVAARVGNGDAVLAGAWRDGVLVGAGLLSLEMPDNQRHRAELRNLAVLPSARRSGVGSAIMQALEKQARILNRSLLTLDAPGQAAKALCRSRNFTEAGRIPGYSTDAGGKPVDTVFFWKRLP